jgi:hypothetical protein
VILHLRAVHNAQHEKGILEVSSSSNNGVTPSPLPLLDTEACPPVLHGRSDRVPETGIILIVIL